LDLQPQLFTWLRNFDGTYDGAFRNGDKTPNLNWDLSSLAIPLNGKVGTPTSFSARGLLTGTSESVAAAVISLLAVSGDGSTGWNAPGAGDTCSNSGSAAGSGAFRLRATFLTVTVDSPVINWNFTTPVSGGAIKWNPGHYGASGGNLDPGNTLSKFQPEMDDMLKDDHIVGYRLFVHWAAVDAGPCAFTASAGGATSATLVKVPSNNKGSTVSGAAFMAFSDGSYRNVTITGNAVTWSGALPAGSITTGHVYMTAVLDSIFDHCRTAYAKPKHYVITLVPMSFNGTRSPSDYSILPQYIAQDSTMGSSPDGASFGWWGPPLPNWNASTTYSVNTLVTYTDRLQYKCLQTATGASQAPGNTAFWRGQGGAFTAAVYRPNVAVQYAACGKALGAKYNSDPYFEAIMDQEDAAVVGPANNFPPRDGSYNDTGVGSYTVARQSIYLAWKAGFPNTSIVPQTKFMRAQQPTYDFVHWQIANGLSLGSSDTAGQAYYNKGNTENSWGQAANFGLDPGGTDFRTHAPFPKALYDVEGPNIGTNTNGAAQGATPLDLVNALNQTVRASHAFWCHVPQNAAVKWADVTAVLKANPLIHTEYPGNYPT
jgi:hypothetical protein